MISNINLKTEINNKNANEYLLVVSNHDILINYHHSVMSKIIIKSLKALLITKAQAETNENKQNLILWSMSLLRMMADTTAGHYRGWLSGNASDSGGRGPGFEPQDRRIVSLSKTL